MPFSDIIKNFRNVESTERVETIDHILNMFSKCMHNNIIVNNPLNYDKYPIDLVKLALGAYFADYAQEDPPTRQALLKLIKQITIGGRFAKAHFEAVYGYIAKHPDDLLGSLELIENMICVDNSHIPMFYFSDTKSYIEISPSLHTEKAFNQGFGFAIWFRLELLNGHQTEGTFPLLFSLFDTAQGGFEAYFEGNTLFYKTMSGKKYESGPDPKAQEVYTFDTERWYSLAIIHNKKYINSEAKFIVNGEVVKEINMEYPKINTGRLDRGFICKNITGQASSVLIFQDYVKTQNVLEIFNRHQKEINADRFVDDLSKNDKFRDDRIKDKILGLYLPSRAVKVGHDIYVEFASHHTKAKLSSIAGVFCQETQKNQFLFCGDVKALLPLMPLFKNITDEELGKKTFQKFLDIICTFTSLLTTDNIKEFSLSDFFGGFFHLFYSIPLKFYTKQTIESLIEIRFKLKEDSAFFNHLIYTTDIWINLDFEIQNFYWEYVKEIYSQDPVHYLQCVGIDKLLQIIKHLTASKQGPCCEKHREIKDSRFARKSARHLPVTHLAEYIRPILKIIRSILSENAKELEISYCINDLANILHYRKTACYRLEILKVLLELVSDEEPHNGQFKVNLKEEKHYFMILKTFNDSYYDVQTYCAKIIKSLELEQTIKEKIFSFMNYSVCPPEQRDIDVSLEDMTAYHSPVFKNQMRNILEQSEELKLNPRESTIWRKKKINSNKVDLSEQMSTEEKYHVKKRESKYLKELKFNFDYSSPASSAVRTNEEKRKMTGNIDITDTVSEDMDSNFSPGATETKEETKRTAEQFTKNTEFTHQETKEEEDCDALDQYLQKLNKKRESKESPIIPDDNVLEIDPHRKSGKSSSPHRKSISNFGPLTAKFKDSTNIPLTASLSSDGDGVDNELEQNVILEELNELYTVFLAWIFSSRSELDSSRPIRYSMVLPLCLNLASKSTKLMKQKAISDFNFMTAYEKNSSIIMAERSFSRFILDLMYTVFPPKTDFEKDPIWEMGCKLYIQMNKICFNTDHEAHFYIHQLIAWPINKTMRHRSTKHRTDVKKKERMVRTILFSFLDTLAADKERDKWTPSIQPDAPYVKFWRNCLNIVFYIEELILSFVLTHQQFNEEPMPKASKQETTYLQEFTSSLLETDYDCPLFAFVEKGLFFSSKNNWQDARLLDTIFDIIEPIWAIKAKKRSSSRFKKSSMSAGFSKMGYNQIENQVLDCIDEIGSNEAQGKILMLLTRKPYPEDSKSKSKEKYSFNFLKTIINLMCVRITIERGKEFLRYYCKMLKDLAECLIYVSETWVSHKNDSTKEVQVRLSRAVGFIIYFLHREIRCRKDKAKDFLHDALNSIMATIFVIVLKRYPKDHEHASTDTPTAKLISIILNGFFEKPDKTLLFIRKDIENYQSKDYLSISSFLTSDQCHDFFEESKTFESIKREFCRASYLEIVSKERYSHAKKLKQMEDTSDYQEKKKYQEINGDIAEKHNKIKNIEEFNRKDTLMWIDHKQRSMKASLKKIYNNMFMWRGVWRNKKLFDKQPEEVPVKIFNFVTKQLSKPILKNMVSNAICYYDEEEGERILKRKHPDFRGDNWKLLNCKEVFEDEISIFLKHRFFSKIMGKEDIKVLENSYTSFLEKYVLRSDKKDVVLGDFKCTVLTPMYSKNGKIVLTRNKLVFYDSLASIDEDMVDISGNSMLDFFTYKKKPYKQLYTVYEVDEIRYAFKRRFLFDKQCIELIFTNCASLTLNFKSRDDFNKFLKQLSEISPVAKFYLNQFKKTKIQELWRGGKISNFFYLMLLNFYGSRSYNDLSQYPVFPWFMSYEMLTQPSFEELKFEPRDFEHNLVMLGSEKRKEQCLERYTEGNGLDDDQYFCGSHYSNPGVILQYLVRLPPYLDGLIKFQSGKLDCADRMYSNFAHSYQLALTEMGDMRELIPETTVLPEMFKNNLKVNFGVTQEDDTVDHVRLPEWAGGDPYFFTCKIKEMLESEEVSQGIHKWFDLIFGYKQKGEAAVEAMNLYPAITYEDGIDLYAPENLENKNALIVQAYNYGQCPSQLFTEPHPEKSHLDLPLQFLEKHADLMVKPFDLNKSKFGDITDIKFINDEEFIMFGKKNILYGMTYIPFTEGQKKEVISEKSNFKKLKISLDELKLHLTEETPKKLLVKGDIQVIIGGFWDGKLVIQNFSRKLEICKSKHLYRITMIEVSESENVIITGTVKGDVGKWVNKGGNLKFESSFFHHSNEVTGCCINEDMGVFATCSKDGTANLYTISPGYILRSFKQPDKLPLRKVLISETPLAAIIIMSLDMKNLTSYSINGRFLSSYDDHRLIENPMVIQDKQFADRLVFGNSTGKLNFFKLPYLDEQEVKSCLEIRTATPIATTPDKRVLIFNHVGLCGIGDFTTNIPKETKEFTNIIGLIRRN